MVISVAEFDAISDFIHRETGIFLDHSKAYLLENRLSPLCPSHDVSTIVELFELAKHNRAAKQDLIDAITTNETYFFRDIKPFELIKNYLVPNILEKTNSCSIWSAASSTGQEAYSISMALKEVLLDLTKFNIKIVGTDISTEAVQRANHGVYTKFELARGLTEKQKERYFKPYKISNEYIIDDEIRYIVQFLQHNLLTSPIISGVHDIVLCRNVAIYFSSSDKRLLFERLHRSLKPNGVLIIGSTESIFEMSDLFRRMSFHGAVYYEKI